MNMCELKIAVSVTRAMKHDDTEFTYDDARVLLIKKQQKIEQSRRNVVDKWDRQIIHVWTNKEAIMNVVSAAWLDIQSKFF